MFKARLWLFHFEQTKNQKAILSFEGIYFEYNILFYFISIS